MYKVLTTRRFEKSLEQMKRRGLPMAVLQEALTLLMNNGVLPS